MLEMHCWITIRSHYSLEDDNLDNMIKTINDKIASLSLNKLFIKAINGEYYLDFSLFSNHMAKDAEDLLHIIIRIFGEIVRYRISGYPDHIG